MTTENVEASPVIELEPFDPLADFEHGPGFEGEPPRPLPAFARRSRFAQARRTMVWSLLTVAAACWVTAPLPFVQTMSWYLLPLGYLNWCGHGLAVLAAIIWIRNATTWGLLDYLRRGEPLTGRVRLVGVNGEGTQEAPLGRFVAEVEFLHPESRDQQSRAVAAPETFPLAQLPMMSAGVEPGDYVTLVSLTDDFDKSLRLYGWLGIDPECDLITKNGKPLTPLSSLGVLLIVLGVTAAFWVLLSFIYVLEAYSPLDYHWQPYAIGVGLASIPMMFLMQFSIDREAPSKLSMPLRRLSVAPLAIFGGFMLGFPSVGFLNGHFDTSPRTLEPVKIVQLWHTTWNFIVRNYELEYQPFPQGGTKKKTVPIETMAMFQTDDLGVVDIGAGILGMRWIRGFHPIAWRDVSELADQTFDGEIKCRFPDEEETLRLAPQILLDGIALPVPAAILDQARARMVTQLTNQLQAEILE